MKTSNSSYMILGFCTVLGLMVVLIVLGLHRMNVMQQHLDVITKQQNKKTMLLNQMREGVQKRRMGVSTILLSHDLFEQEDERAFIDGYAMQVVKARDGLREMSLTDVEKNAFLRIAEAMRVAYPLQLSLIDRSVAGEPIAKLENLRKKTVKLQKDLTDRISDLERIQQKETLKAVQHAEQSYRDTETAMLILGTVAILLGILVTVFVYRVNRLQDRISKRALEDLRRANDQLEKRVTERTTDLAVARDVALAASEAKSRFLANMSHELRTPLNAIIGYSEMLQEEAEEHAYDTCITDLGRIHGAGKHLLSLIDNILDLSKIEAGKIELDLDTFDITPMVDDVMVTIHPLAKIHCNQLQVSCSLDIGEMRADIVKVRQALFNLLSNACKFTENGTISLKVYRHIRENKQEWIVFDIQDTGIGLSSDQVEKIFLEFTQADPSTTRKYGGSGLGLVISQRFCQKMGGEIAVESRLGEGSVFTMCLPAEIKY